MTHKNKVLVIIVTYNGMAWMERCLSSVENSTVAADVYIVDNGSTDGTSEFVKNNYPQYFFVQSEKNLGFGAANNMGLRYAVNNNYDYVYLLNQDAWVDHNTIETLINVNRNNLEYGILSPIQINEKRDKLDEIFNYFVSQNRDIQSDYMANKVKDVYAVDFIMAAHWLMSVELVKVIGAFSPLFFHYGEDDDYINRVINRGLKIGVVPRIYGVHDREFRPVTLTKERYLARATFLKILTNPNMKLFKSLRRAVRDLNKRTRLMIFKYRDPKVVVDYFSIMSKIPQAIRARKDVVSTDGIYL